MSKKICGKYYLIWKNADGELVECFSCDSIDAGEHAAGKLLCNFSPDQDGSTIDIVLRSQMSRKIKTFIFKAEMETEIVPEKTD